jgi:hypothetical protein
MRAVAPLLYATELAKSLVSPPLAVKGSLSHRSSIRGQPHRHDEIFSLEILEMETKHCSMSIYRFSCTAFVLLFP